MRLWQRLFLAFAVLSSVALVSFVGWQQLSFRRGFLDFLNGVALQRLQDAGDRLASAYRTHGNWDFLRDDPAQFDMLIDPAMDPRDRPPPPPRDGRGFDPSDPRMDRPPPRNPGDHRERRPPRDPAPFRGDDGPPPGRPGGPPPHPPNPFQLPGRVSLLDSDGAPIVGPPASLNATSLSVRVDDQVVGTLRLNPLPQLLGGLDSAFAASQWRHALIAGIAVLAIALLLALALARWLLAPVRDLAAGTRALAAGDYARRLPERSDELGALARNFNGLALALESHRDQRRQWGADIAHELRTPVSVLRGEIQALQDGVRALTPEALNSLQAESERLTGLIEDLYQLALADVGALDYRFESLDVVELVNDAAQRHAPALAAAGLVLELDLSTCPHLRGDERRLMQLLDNLLANSRRYTDAPGRIRMQTRSDAQAIRIVVEDSAPGVSTQDLPRLFERLFRVERSRNRSAGGAGLGLAICRAIVRAHDGRIAASASSLGGVRIDIVLPHAPGAPS